MNVQVESWRYLANLAHYFARILADMSNRQNVLFQLPEITAITRRNAMHDCQKPVKFQSSQSMAGVKCPDGSRFLLHRT